MSIHIEHAGDVCVTMADHVTTRAATSTAAAAAIPDFVRTTIDRIAANEDGLAEVNLGAKRITPRGFVLLGQALKGNTHLKSLYLYDTNIKHAGRYT